MNEYKSLYPSLHRWLEQGHKIALVSLIETWGSSPRQIGAKLAVNENLEIIGSVSAGCLEGAVIEAAQLVIKNAQAFSLELELSDIMAFEEGLACGGKMRVWIEPYDKALHEITSNFLLQYSSLQFIHFLSPKMPSKKQLIQNGEIGFSNLSREESEKLTAFGTFPKTGIYQIEDGEIFVENLVPALNLLIVGAGHIAQALLALANVLAYPTIVIDPRSAFLSEARFPDTARFANYPKEIWAALAIHEKTALVLLSHDPKIDDGALELALKSNVFYIGALGSKRNHAERIRRFSAKGFSPEELARIHAPIGLDIGAKRPEEIALAILAEIVAVYNE